MRDRAEVIYITNEAHLGDFGMDGMNFGTKAGVVPSQMFTESLFQERGVKADPGRAHRERGTGGCALRAAGRDKGRAALRLRDAATAVPGRGPEGLRRTRTKTSPTRCSRPAGS
ncbi:MAG: hypothetical protein V9G10_10790 [Candidatus Nanopelagicales bacterium]